jgi:group II intron reverse transcriptase/maturase
MQSVSAMKRLEAIPNIVKSGRRVNGLFRLLSCRELWHQAYSRIATNGGSMTPGVDGKTFDGASIERFDELASRVLEGSYKPTPVRRVYIPKANGKLRPLGIPTSDDRMVQEVVRRVLDAVYEPIFSVHSHGFRAGRSCHTALKNIKDVWSGVKWFVEVDIEGYFDNIGHKILMGLLEKKIDDKRFLRLINSFLQAGYLENWRFHRTYSGTPQGGIISPLLANVYLHELDKFMEAWILERDKGKKRAVHPEYMRRCHRTGSTKRSIKMRRERLQANGAVSSMADEQLQRLLHLYKERQAEQAQQSSTNPFDPEYRRYRYVRYADDFLIGVIGSKADAQEVMDKVREFLTILKLSVSEKKSTVRHAADGVIFLGYDIHTWSWPNRTARVSDKMGRVYTKRAPSDRVTLNVPREKMLEFCNQQRYGDLSSMKGVQRFWMVNSSEFEIVAQFNSEIRGFAQYYSLAGQAKAQLARLERVCRVSLYKTLAAKLTISMVRVFRQMRGADGELYGRSVDLHGRSRRVRVWKLKHLQPPQKSSAEIDQKHLVPMMVHRNDLVDLLHVKQCSNCGSSAGPFEVHHVRKLTDHKDSPFMEFIKAARTRKRIPLCSDCHHDLHNGRLPDYRLRVNRGMESRVQ